MSSKLKCHKNLNFNIKEMSENWHVTKSELSALLELQHNWKCHQNWDFTKTEISSKLKCQQN